MFIIVGLGNPGLKYRETRHNIGFRIIDKVMEEYRDHSYKNKFRGEIAELRIKDEKVIFLKPQTYMNLSGESIVEVVNFYKIDVEKELIVIYDDMDLPTGKIKLKQKGSSGGHNGIKSIIQYCGNKFIRIKCGIGKPQKNRDVIRHVLSKFTPEEQEIVDVMLETGADVIDDFINGKNIERIIQKYNSI